MSHTGGERQLKGLLVACRLPAAHQRSVDGRHEDPQARDTQDHNRVVVSARSVCHSVQVGERVAVHAADPGRARTRSGGSRERLVVVIVVGQRERTRAQRARHRLGSHESRAVDLSAIRRVVHEGQGR